VTHPQHETSFLLDANAVPCSSRGPRCVATATTKAFATTTTTLGKPAAIERGARFFKPRLGHLSRVLLMPRVGVREREQKHVHELAEVERRLV
jgi:hypothetical protein